MINTMSVVGDKFSLGEIFVPEMLVAAKAIQKGVKVLKPILAGDEAISFYKKFAKNSNNFSNKQ